MSSASFEFPFHLVIGFIVGFIVKHYLEEMRARCQKFVEIVQECWSRIGSRQTESFVGYSFWKTKRFGIIICFGLNLSRSALKSQVGYNASLQLLRKAIWLSFRRTKDSEGVDKHRLNNLDWFQLSNTRHLEFGSVPFSPDCARSHSPWIDHQGDGIVPYFVIDFGQNKHFSLQSHSLGCSWPLQLPGGKEAIENVKFLVEELLYSRNHHSSCDCIRTPGYKNAEGSAAGFASYF